MSVTCEVRTFGTDAKAVSRTKSFFLQIKKIENEIMRLKECFEDKL